MFTLTAPYPLLQTTTLLPNPQLSDQEGLTATVTRKTAMDGTRYTYVKRKGDRRKLKWSFRLMRNKGLELRDFLVRLLRFAGEDHRPQRSDLDRQLHE